MRAAEDRGLGIGHLALERIDVRAHQRIGKDHVALFDRIDHTAAGLRLNIHANGAEGQLALKGAARHGRGRREQRHVFHGHLARRAVIAPFALGQRLDQRDENTQYALVGGNPAFLHPAQRGGRGGVAGQDHKVAALVPQPRHGLGREVVDIVGVAHAIGRVGVVAEVDERHFRQTLRDRVQHRQPAKPRVEYPYCHRLPPYARRRSSNSYPVARQSTGVGDKA